MDDKSKRIEEIKVVKSHYMKVFNTEDGQKVLDDLKGRCYFHKSTVDSNHGYMSFNEGMRAVVLHIETMLNLDTVKLEENRHG